MTILVPVCSDSERAGNWTQTHAFSSPVQARSRWRFRALRAGSICAGASRVKWVILLAASFPPDAMQAATDNGVRYYTVGRREESETKVWRRLRLVTYRCDSTTGRLDFEQAD